MGRLILYSITAAVPLTAGLTQTPVLGQVLVTAAAGVVAVGILLAAASTLSLLGAALLTAGTQQRLQREQSLKVPGAPPAVGLHRSTTSG